MLKANALGPLALMGFALPDPKSLRLQLGEPGHALERLRAEESLFMKKLREIAFFSKHLGKTVLRNYQTEEIGRASCRERV